MRLSVSLASFVFLLSSSSQPIFSQGFSPDEAQKNLWVGDGLHVSLFASEPEVRQAIFVKCDDRGRLWTIQYLQYPNPAGLERVNVDRWSRTTYDRVPEPPPHGPRGADRITILEDSDGDGRAEKFKDFVDGLNLVTGVEFGHGGVYVLNVPYLLFYPDRNRDDVPDCDPQVLLQGFGMEDAQSFANHLTWGPDGWLYGVNGSTTTCRIRGVEFQQGVWRYHPVLDQFELFCEGGQNCFGLTFDCLGNLFYSTNGGPFVHAIQGGYFYKSFGKHGPLHNLHAYHFFGPLDCDSAPGGPPTGGSIYRGELLPEEYRNKFLAGNFLGHSASSWRIEPKGSSVRATYEALFFDARDSWSGPTDLCVGPDGAVYISDFFDQRTAHPDPDAKWDDRNGRIYRIDVPGNVAKPIVDIRVQSTDQLVELVVGTNAWLADRARVELAARRDHTSLQTLDARLLESNNPLVALNCLWSRYVIDGLPDDLAIRLLDHADEHLRAWGVRLIGDDSQASPHISRAIANLAAIERSLVVRASIAATAKRLPAELSLPIIWNLTRLQDELPDERVEWSMWWAVEDKALTAADQILKWALQNKSSQTTASMKLVDLLIRRFAAEGSIAAYDYCAQVLSALSRSGDDSALRALRDGLAERAVELSGVHQGGLFQSVAVPEADDDLLPVRRYEQVAGSLLDFIAEQWQRRPADSLIMELALLAEVEGASASFQTRLADPTAERQQVNQALALAAKYGRSNLTPQLLSLFEKGGDEARQLLIVDALKKSSNVDVSGRLLQVYHHQTPEVRSRIRQFLLSRPDSCLAVLQNVDRGIIPNAEIPVAQLARVALHKQPELDALVRKHWGNIGPGTTEEKLATMRRLNNDLRSGKGDINGGKLVFTKYCGTCHKLFGEGGAIGPDLTGTTRHDQAALLASMVDPSAVVRREYLTYVARTLSGNVHIGLLAEQDAASATLLDAENRRTRILREELEDLRESPVSIMPERLLEQLSPEQLRDLFAYLQK